GDKGFKGLNGEGVKVASSNGGESGEALDGLDAFVEGLDQGDRGLNSGVEKADEDGFEDETRQKWREVEGKTGGKAKEKIVDKTESKSSRK
ncbi:hypothetical protein Gotur_032305, partial [Gossypium turneri]